jgi:hypothetical protein
MTVNSESPRVLRLTFDLHVPAGLRRNVHWSKVESAIANFTTVIQGTATRVFPWATKLQVTSEWIYLWHHGEEDVDLASTELNIGPYKDDPGEG